METQTALETLAAPALPGPREIRLNRDTGLLKLIACACMMCDHMGKMVYPLMLVALGGCFSEHSGVINIGLEGIMVFGALGGALVMSKLPAATPAVWVVVSAILAAMLMGLLYSLLLAVAAINFKADQTLVGTAMNLLGTAAATVIVKAINTSANPNNRKI